MPRSVRDGGSADAFSQPHDGLPEWLQEPVIDWLRPFFRGYNSLGEGHVYAETMRTMQTRMHLMPPLDWSTATNAASSLFERARLDGEFALDVVDYLLHHLWELDRWKEGREAKAETIDSCLRDGGSAWEVTPVEPGQTYALTRRTIGPVPEMVSEIRADAERAADHLAQAWVHLMGRAPVPDQAYFHAVLAVEAAAKPIISPHDSQATLGKMISAVRAKPGKWSFVLGESAASILEPAELLWKTQRRHGTDEQGAPLGMSQDEADAAVHLSLSLVRWFVSGAFKRVH